MAVSPCEVYDGFSRSHASSWQQSDSTSQWGSIFGSTATYSTHNYYGRIYVPYGTGSHIMGLVNRPRQSEREMLVRFSVNNYSDMQFGLVLNHNTTTDTHYRVGIYGNNELRLLAWVQGNHYIVGAATIPTPTANTKYWMRARYNASNGRFYGKMWADGTTEPANWQLNVAANTTLLSVQTGVPALLTRGVSISYTVNVYDLYVYSLDPDYERPLPVIDSFNRTRIGGGWGMSESRHLWEGQFSADPALSNHSLGHVDASAGISTGNTSQIRIGTIGPAVNDSEVYTELTINGSSGLTYLGIRGSMNTNGTLYTGYFIRLAVGDVVKLYKHTSYGAVGTLLNTSSFSVASATKYKVKIRASNLNIAYKIWKATDAEPSSWTGQVSDSSISSGRALLWVAHDNAAPYYEIHHFEVTEVTSTDWTVVDHLDWGSVDTESNVDVHYTGDDNDDVGFSVQHRISGTDDPWTTDYRTLATVTQGGFKIASMVLQNLRPNTEYDVVVSVNDPDGVSGGSTHQLTITTTDKSIDIHTPLDVVVDATDESLTLTVPYYGDSDDDATCSARIKEADESTYGSFVTATKDSVSKTFTVTFDQLDHDTLYDVQFSFLDIVGYRINGEWGGTGPSSHTIQAMTVGKSIKMVSVSALPAETSALVSVQYEYDHNDNATFAIQYRSVKERIFTTVNPATISVDHLNKTAYTTLPFLDPETTYEVVVTVSDPDGLTPYSPSTLRTTFNTLGAIFDPDEKGKHYIYRVYNPEGEYLGTWPDAPDPRFTWDQNGGVNDLSVTLPRRFSSLNYERTINFNNRVDVWCLDGTSRGMGTNLIEDTNGDKGGWVLDTGWSVTDDEGADGTPCLKFESNDSTLRRIVSEPINVERVVPFVLTAIARATGGKLRMDIAAYDADDNLIDVVDENAETVNYEWQRIAVEWLPPANTDYLRVRIENDGHGTMRIHKVSLLVREKLIYRGEIDEYTVSIGPEGESVTVDILGYVSYLSDDYIDFLQFVAVQPQSDIDAGRTDLRQDPTDPANMLRQVIDIARQQNPKCPLYYTEESIKPTGVVAQYTFRERLLRDCFDKIVAMCPPSWHYYIEPDGCVWLRSSEEHATIHKLRLNVEVAEYESERSIRRLKNVVRFTGRQDEDGSEPDGHGTIKHIAQDTQSIAEYGRRVVLVRDAQVTDPQTAEIIAEGRLEEYNVVEEAGRAVVPDEKDMRTHQGSLHGYNIQAIKPGDLIQIIDPETGPNHSFWDQFIWDEDLWDTKSHRLLTSAVPVTSIEVDGTQVTLHLAHLPPTTRGDFARMLGVMRRNAED